MTTILGSDYTTHTGIDTVSKYGLATILALAFFWWLTSSVEADIHEIRATQIDHASETAYFLRQICINTATDEAQRANCVPPKR